MLFITGTDTGVGKTYISSIIGKHLKYKENKNISKYTKLQQIIYTWLAIKTIK